MVTVVITNHLLLWLSFFFCPTPCYFSSSPAERNPLGCLLSNCSIHWSWIRSDSRTWFETDSHRVISWRCLLFWLLILVNIFMFVAIGHWFLNSISSILLLSILCSLFFSILSCGLSFLCLCGIHPSRLCRLYRLLLCLRRFGCTLICLCWVALDFLFLSLDLCRCRCLWVRWWCLHREGILRRWCRDCLGVESRIFSDLGYVDRITLEWDVVVELHNFE